MANYGYTVIHQCFHSRLEGGLPDGISLRTARDSLLEFFIHDQQFVDSGTSPVSGMKTFRASPGAENFNTFKVGRIQPGFG